MIVRDCISLIFCARFGFIPSSWEVGYVRCAVGCGVLLNFSMGFFLFSNFFFKIKNFYFINFNYYIIRKVIYLIYNQNIVRSGPISTRFPLLIVLQVLMFGGEVLMFGQVYPVTFEFLSKMLQFLIMVTFPIPFEAHVLPQLPMLINVHVLY